MNNEKEIISAYMAEMGKKGGAVKSEKKSAASAENGRKGGKPSNEELDKEYAGRIEFINKN